MDLRNIAGPLLASALLLTGAARSASAQIQPDLPKCTPQGCGCGGDCETPTPAATRTPTPPPSCSGSCIPSGTEYCINRALSSVGSTAVLCQNAVFSLNGPINFTADQQQVYTQNSPTDASRALLNVNGHFGAAVKGKNHSGVQLRNVRINGNRPTFGHLSGSAGEALIELGGDGASQVLSYLDVKEPQGWSCLHLIGGSTVSCTGATVTHNTIGPAGQPDGTWADGLSIECRNTEVAYNTITDATDGAIVIFSAPGSHVHDNTVIAATRTLLGGIHMVGATYGGDYTGTLVSNNTISAQGALIKVAVPMGPRVWGCGQTATIFGGMVTMNTLTGAHMGYGFAVDGVSSWTVTGNVDQSTHTGTPGAQSCNSSPPAPAGF